MIEAAHGAGRTKDTFLGTMYRRLAGRIGKCRAAIAVGHRILVIMYNLLAKQEDYEELGANYYDERQRQLVEGRLVRRLEKLGYEVTLQAKAKSA